MQIVTRRLLATGVKAGTETGPHSITAQTGFELITLLPQPPQCRDYKHKHHTQPPKSSYSNDQTQRWRGWAVRISKLVTVMSRWQPKCLRRPHPLSLLSCLSAVPGWLCRVAIRKPEGSHTQKKPRNSCEWCRHRQDTACALTGPSVKDHAYLHAVFPGSCSDNLDPSAVTPHRQIQS